MAYVTTNEILRGNRDMMLLYGPHAFVFHSVWGNAVVFLITLTEVLQIIMRVHSDCWTFSVKSGSYGYFSEFIPSFKFISNLFHYPFCHIYISGLILEEFWYSTFKLPQPGRQRVKHTYPYLVLHYLTFWSDRTFLLLWFFPHTV